MSKDANDLSGTTDNLKNFFLAVTGLKNAPFQDDIDDYLSKGFNKKLCFAVPRGFGKSTHCSVFYPLWEIAKNHNIRILIISNSSDIAKKFVNEIITHVEGNRAYRGFAEGIDSSGKGVLPKTRGSTKIKEQWGAEAMTVDRDDLSVSDPTVSGVGLFGSIVSKRADIIIVDDLVNQENAETEEQRGKIKDWFYTTLMPVLVPGGRVICVGNVWHEDDLISNLLTSPHYSVKEKYPAIKREPSRPELWEMWYKIECDDSLSIEKRRLKAQEFYNQHLKEMDDGIELLWPEKFSYHYLFKIRKEDPIAFAKMYQCKPLPKKDEKKKSFIF